MTNEGRTHLTRPASDGLAPDGLPAGGRAPEEPPPDELPLERVQQAEAVIRRFFPPTPLLRAPRLSQRFGAEIWLKLETVTPIRVFKLRGALAKIARLPEGVGVISASTGNHGLAVARAARLTGRPATIWVPARANAQKVEAIRAEGARVVEHGVDYFEAYQGAVAMARELGLAFVHAYDDPDVIAGQGTIALELARQGEFDSVLCGVGGGGLVSGLAVAFRHLGIPSRVVGVQPEGADAMARSLAAGSVVSLEAVHTIAEGLAARRPGDRTFALTRRYADRVVVVSDSELREAAVALLADEHLVAEPSGVAGLAAVIRYGAAPFGRRLCVVVSGGNVSEPFFRELLREAARR